MTIAAIGSVVLITADGEAREAPTFPDGSYACPFCSSAVISAESWADNEANNARIYEAQGEGYVVAAYPAYMAEAFAAGKCANPACLTGMSAEVLAGVRERIAAREAEEASRQRNHELAMRRMADTRAAESALWDELAAKAETGGKCARCLRASGWRYGRAVMVAHRDPGNCPEARKYAR